MKKQKVKVWKKYEDFITKQKKITWRVLKAKFGSDRDFVLEAVTQHGPELENLKEFSNNTDLNCIEINNTEIGVIASGMCINFAKEVFGKEASYLKLGFTFPMPDKKINDYLKSILIYIKIWTIVS